MKTDELEKFVTQNRKGFDDLSPDEALWAKIQTKTKPVRSISVTKILLRIAAVFLIFVASYYYHDYRAEKKQSAFLMSEADAGQLEEAKNFFEAKAYYTSLIGNKEKEVFNLSKDYPEIKQEVKLEFKELDQELTALQKDLRDGASNEQIIEAMIQNYRIKLEILEDLLLELSTVKNEEKNNQHEI